VPNSFRLIQDKQEKSSRSEGTLADAAARLSIQRSISAPTAATSASVGTRTAGGSVRLDALFYAILAVPFSPAASGNFLVMVEASA